MSKHESRISRGALVAVASASMLAMASFPAVADEGPDDPCIEVVGPSVTPLQPPRVRFSVWTCSGISQEQVHSLIQHLLCPPDRGDSFAGDPCDDR